MWRVIKDIQESHFLDALQYAIRWSYMDLIEKPKSPVAYQNFPVEMIINWRIPSYLNKTLVKLHATYEISKLLISVDHIPYLHLF